MLAWLSYLLAYGSHGTVVMQDSGSHCLHLAGPFILCGCHTLKFVCLFVLFISAIIFAARSTCKSPVGHKLHCPGGVH
jgi:hypothetical protein